MEKYKPFRVQRGMHHQAVSDGFDTLEEAIEEAKSKVKENVETFHVHRVMAVIEPVIGEPNVRQVVKDE